MSDVLNLYACRSCDHTQIAKEKPAGCEKCGGVLSQIHGVQIVESEEETKKYTHELSRQSRHYSSEKQILPNRVKRN